LLPDTTAASLLEDHPQQVAMRIVGDLVRTYAGARGAVGAARALMEEVNGEDGGASEVVWACRPDAVGKRLRPRWEEVPVDELLPGDVFKFAEGEANGDGASSDTRRIAVPFDAVLIEGSIVVDEAALTGESIPQSKVPIRAGDDDGDSDDLLDLTDGIASPHRNSILFGGTTTIHSEGTSRLVVLRTGPHSTVSTHDDFTVSALFFLRRRVEIQKK